MRKLPYEVDQFEALRQGGFYYADKTRHLYRLASSMEPHSLARPPLFGKTLLVSALEAVLQGRRELFEGLWIEGSDYDWKPRPVIRLSAGKIEADSAKSLSERLTFELREIAEKEDLTIGESGPKEALESLIKSLYEKRGQKAAVLIDGYDGPVLSRICYPELAKKLAMAMADFLEALEGAEERLGPALITGVTRLSNVVVFNKLGRLRDLTMDEDYADVCGFTTEEFDALLKDQSERPMERGVLPPVPGSFKSAGSLSPKGTAQDIREKILSDLSGYSWDGKTRLLNPYSAISALRHGRFGDEWFASLRRDGLKALLSGNLQIHELIRARTAIIPEANFFNLEVMLPAPLFFQAGFLTVESVDKSSGYSKCRLGYPNPKVEASVYETTLGLSNGGQWLIASRAEGRAMLEAMALKDASKLEAAFERLRKLAARPPREMKSGYYKNILLLALSAAGQSFDSQGPAWDEIFFGRLGGPDGPGIAVKTALVTGEMGVRWSGLDPVMVKLSDSDLERRMEKAAEEALDQIEERRAGVRFIGQPQEIIKCAMVFGPGWTARAAFKKAGHWRLSPSGDRYAAS